MKYLPSSDNVADVLQNLWPSNSSKGLWLWIGDAETMTSLCHLRALYQYFAVLDTSKGGGGGSDKERTSERTTNDLPGHVT